MDKPYKLRVNTTDIDIRLITAIWRGHDLQYINLVHNVGDVWIVTAHNSLHEFIGKSGTLLVERMKTDNVTAYVSEQPNMMLQMVVDHHVDLQTRKFIHRFVKRSPRWHQRLWRRLKTAIGIPLALPKT